MKVKYNSSYIGLRKDLLQFIPDSALNLSVLDVGCAVGSNGYYLKNIGSVSYVEGIELDKGMATEAAQKIDKVICGDLEDPETLKKISKRKFDYILLGDILEHLVNPWATLTYLSANHLAAEGKIIISIPNIQHVDVFIHVFLKGVWPHNERGIFDKTHLRFFTLRSIISLIEDASLRIEVLHRKFRYRDRIGSKFPIFSRGLLTKIFPNYFTFQYLVVCSHDE